VAVAVVDGDMPGPRAGRRELRGKSVIAVTTVGVRNHADTDGVRGAIDINS
jgi:hypothetical protein